MSDLTIVVGDTHIGPGQNLRRADWLGRYIKDIKPNRVVYIGDHNTFDSLSAWDKDKRKKMEGRRFQKDLDTLKKFTNKVNAAAGRYEYESILTEGNHEYRVDRYIDYHPELDGQLEYVVRGGLEGFKIIPYMSFYKHKGISFTHVPIMENGRPVSGKYATARSLDICAGSVVFGHTHKLDYRAVHKHGQAHLQEALNVGCYFEHVDEYALGSMTSYWRGLVTLEHYQHGRFKFDCTPMGMLKKEYA